MTFAESLDWFFADFGEDGTLDGQAVRVIFDAAATVGLGSPGIAASDPQVTLPTASVPAAVHGKLLDLPTRGTFRVREHQPDFTGLSVLTLTRA